MAKKKWQKRSGKNGEAKKGWQKRGGKKGVAKKRWQKRGDKKGVATTSEALTSPGTTKSTST